MISSDKPPIDIAEINRSLTATIAAKFSLQQGRLPDTISIDEITPVIVDFLSQSHPELLNYGCSRDVLLSETLAALTIVSGPSSKTVGPTSLDESALLGFKVQCDIKVAIIPAIFAAVVAALAGDSVFGGGSLLSNVTKAEVFAALSYLPAIMRIHRNHKLTEKESYVLRHLAIGTRTAQELANRSCLPLRTVRHILSNLESKKLIEVCGTVAKAKEYQLVEG